MRTYSFRPSLLRSSLAALAVALSAAPALAQTVVDGATTTPLSTSTAGNITVNSGGSIAVGSGSAITVDSNNNVTNDGALNLVPSSDNAAGITITGGNMSTIASGGTISLAEAYVRSGNTAPIAVGTNRYGIRLAGGGALTGNISHGGAINIEGRNSGGIYLESTLNGSLVNSGTINMFGENNFGIRTAAVTGNVSTGTGAITVIGQGSIALATIGNVGGTVSISGKVQQALTYTNDNGATESITVGAANVNAPAVWIGGSVGGGVVVDSAGGAIQSFGNGAGLMIGRSEPSVIGPVTGNDAGYSVLIGGTINANANFAGLTANAMVVGRDIPFAPPIVVSLPGGIGVTGTIKATGTDSGANAVLIIHGATVPRLINSGSISTTGTGPQYAVRDLSGTLTRIENSGLIGVGGATNDTRRAIDLSANGSGVTISQSLSSVTGAALPSIIGDIVTGSGNDILSITAGTVAGNAEFGAGNDQLLLAGDGIYLGNVNFGTGTATASLTGKAGLSGIIDFGGGVGSLTLADTATFIGSIANGGTSSVTVNGGNFRSSAVGNVALGSLTVGSGGTLTAYIDTATHTSSRLLVNSATFVSGAKLAANLTSGVNAQGSYTVLSANVLNGAPAFDGSSLPFIYNGAVAASGNNIVLTISRKTAAELGLTRAQASAYDAILASTGTDTNLSGAVLGSTTADGLRTLVSQLLPDHSGGVFDVVTRASRLTAQHVMNADSFFTISSYGGWFEPVYWRAKQGSADVASYSNSGWGATIGAEKNISVGRVGLSYSFLKGKVKNNGGTGAVKTTQHEFSLFWRRQDGPVYYFLRGSAAPLKMSGRRSFSGSNAATTFAYESAGSWKGWLFSGTGGISVDANIGDRLTFRPRAVVDHYRLNEKAYQEIGTSAAMNLNVAKRKSDVTSATTTLTAVYRLGQPERESRPFTLTLEGGRRSILSGAAGDTTANFANGTPFSITPDKLKSAWLGEASIFIGGLDFTWKVSLRGERVSGDMNYAARTSFSAAF